MLRSYEFRNKLSACFRPLTSAHNEKKKKNVTVQQNVGLHNFMEEVARKSHASEKPSRLPNLGIMFSPMRIERSDGLSQFPTHAWLLCFGVLVQQSDVANCIGVEDGSTHACDGDQEKVLKSKNVFLTRNTEWDSQSLQRRCCREDRFDPFMAHLRTHQTRTVTWDSALPLLVSIHLRPTRLRPYPTLAKAGDVAVDPKFQRHTSQIVIAGTLHS